MNDYKSHLDNSLISQLIRKYAQINQCWSCVDIVRTRFIVLQRVKTVLLQNEIIHRMLKSGGETKNPGEIWKLDLRVNWLHDNVLLQTIRC